jgi:hypothetical protein
MTLLDIFSHFKNRSFQRGKILPRIVARLGQMLQKPLRKVSMMEKADWL